jgi:hypothetical protein
MDTKNECKHDSLHTESELNFVHCGGCGKRQLKTGGPFMSVLPGLSYGPAEDKQWVEDLIRDVNHQQTRASTAYTAKEIKIVGPGMTSINESVSETDNRYEKTPPEKKLIELASNVRETQNLYAFIGRFDINHNDLVWCLRKHSPLFHVDTAMSV